MRGSTIKISKEKTLDSKDKTLFIILALITVSFFLSFFFLKEPITELIEGTILDHRNGFIHFLAFILGVFTIIALIDTKKYFGNTITSSYNLFIVALSSVSLVHIWELLTEGWHIFDISDLIIEVVEYSMHFLSILFFLLVYLMIKKKLKI